MPDIKQSKKLKSSSSTSGNPSTTLASSRSQVATAKKRSTLKQKSGKSDASTTNKNVLGGADYVSLLMGSRQKVREEALKLPQDD